MAVFTSARKMTAKEQVAYELGKLDAVKHGRWKFHSNGDGTCDQCHFTQKNIWDYDSWQNFCGHCGAKMDKEG